MQGLIAVTDYEWFDFLRRQPPLDEVNFWRPSDTRTPRLLQPGAPVIFKLRRKYGGWIVGFGIFARHDVVPAWLAWESFGVKNGAETFSQMRSRIERLRNDGKTASHAAGDYQIGCLMLSEPVFFDQPAWLRPPADWPDTAVQGKTYELSAGEGRRVWEECRLRGTISTGTSRGVGEPSAPGERYGEPMLIRPRLGQGTFRLAVTAAYGRACAITQEHSLPVLEASHIRPYADDGPHDVSNGLLFRSDIHRLFDKGYVAVDPQLRFVVSRCLKEEFENGRSYYPLHGRVIQLPRNPTDHPDRRNLTWHLESCFKG